MTKRAPGGAQRPWGGAELSEMSLVTCVSSVYTPSSLPPPLLCSLLALLWHHTLAVLTAAAGPQVPSVQHCRKLHCALKVPGRVVVGGVPGWAPGCR